jgi:hypothetical protein
MSLYNMLHGFEPTAGFVLHVLNVYPSAIPRFRDAYVTYRDEVSDKDALVMVILTRTGGANRDEFAAENAGLCLLPGYLDTADDEFDSTFALFRYALPEQWHAHLMEYLTVNGAPMTLRQKTEQASGPDQTVRQKQATEKMLKLILDAVRETK